MAITAIALYLVFGTLGFGWRSWMQYRRTGSTGFRGIGGRPGSLEWLAGVGFVIAMVAVLVAAVLQLTGMITAIGFLVAPWIQASGTVLAVVGIAATVYSQLEMGDSWRIGVDSSETTALVRHGVFARVRNPIYTAMLTFTAGIALMTPNLLALGAFWLLLSTIELHVRVVEEPHLLQTHGDTYRHYQRAVGRFVPGIGRPAA